MNKRLTKNIPQTIGGVLALIAFREMFANYGYEESMKRILAKQIQQILEREGLCQKKVQSAKRNRVFFLVSERTEKLGFCCTMS